MSRRRLAALVCAVVVGGAAVGSLPLARAANGGNPDKPGFFTCSASALRLTINGGPTIEPFAVGDAEGHCTDAQAGLLSNQAVGPATVSVLNATTEAQARGSQAAAQVLHVTLGPVEVTLLESFASAQCQNNTQGHPTARRPILGGGAQVASIKVNGTELVPAQVNQPGVTEIPGVATITVAQEERQTTTGRDRGGAITERALVVETAIANLVVAEARADYHGQPCAPGQTRKSTED